MKRLFATHHQHARRIAHMPVDYAADMAAATIETADDGFWFDADHAAMAKYRRVSGSVLAGDKFAALAKRFGADRMMKAISRVTGKGCRCDARRRWLNRLHARLIRGQL